MPSLFSRIKAAVKAAVKAFKQPPEAQPPKAAPPKAQPPTAAPPKERKSKSRENKNKRITRLQQTTLNKNRDTASTFYAATVGLWNVPEGNTKQARNQLIIDKLGVSNLREAYELVMNRYNELMLNKADDDSDSPPPELTQLQYELSGRIQGQNELTS